MVNREKLAQLIIELRKKKGYSQRKLAMVSGVSNSTISRIESATSDADPETLKKLAPCLGVSYEILMQAAGYIDADLLNPNILNNKTIKNKLGNRIIKLRNEAGMTQAELAKLLGVSQQTISKYEKGIREPDNATLIKLSEIFNCSIDYILGNSDEKENKIIKDNDDEIELTPDEIELLKKIKSDPDLSVLFHDLKSAPKKKIKQLLKTWEFINEQFEEMEKELDDK